MYLVQTIHTMVYRQSQNIEIIQWNDKYTCEQQASK